MVHKYLKCGRSVTEPEEHDSGLEQSHGGDKGSLPLVLLLDVDVVVFPSNVEFGKQGGFFHVINELRNEGERVGISDCVGVQVAVILAWMLLCERCLLTGVAWTIS